MDKQNRNLMLMAVALAGLGIGGGQGVALAAGPSGMGAAVGPRIEFDSAVLDFGKAAAGKVIDHNFVFTNTGDEMLEIKDVQPTCGCTVAGVWDRKVAPGNTGVIPIRFTPAYSDREIFKTIIVDSNDSRGTNMILELKGTIWEPIDVSPAVVMFGASADCQTNLTRTVRIVNNLDQPLSVSDPQCADQSFRIQLKTVRPGKEFELEITMTPPLKTGSATIPVTLKTSSTVLPTINITVFSTVLPVLVATPSQITLSPGPLAVATESKVAIQNNGAQSIVLSKPAVNADRVKVDLTEVQPGRQYALVASFPAGFQAKPGENLQVRVKTDDPQYPVLTIPIFQNQRLSTLLNTDADRGPANGP